MPVVPWQISTSVRPRVVGENAGIEISVRRRLEEAAARSIYTNIVVVIFVI